LVFVEARFLDAAERPDGGHRAAAFDETAVGPLVADADSAGDGVSLAVKKIDGAVIRHVGTQQSAGTAEMVDGFAALLAARDIMLVLVRRFRETLAVLVYPDFVRMALIGRGSAFFADWIVI